LSKPLAIFKGCNPLSIKYEAYSNKAPANTTTPVVPSPISSSYDFDNSTNNLAVGCSISIFSTIVAPSFVTTTSPSPDTNILSIPLGPKEVLRVDDKAQAANMLDLTASIPFNLNLCAYSLIMMYGLPNSSNAILISF